MRKEIKPVLLLLILLLAHSASGSDKLELTGKATDETRTKEIKLPATEPSSKAHLKVTATIESGEVIWTLRDPNGKARLTGGKRGDITLDSGELQAIKGTWVLQIEMKGATFNYEIRWRTN